MRQRELPQWGGVGPVTQEAGYFKRTCEAIKPLLLIQVAA
jgi:hypothetical protein